MTYRGKVVGGKVVLPPGADLPEGSEVAVLPVVTAKEAAELADGLLRIAKKVRGLPPDLAKNHDHYLHGHPKK
ncbi:MAG: hypothetical protein FJ272_11890 [Planctomycetes bacterium]|nr:hypothetical protein [Planctomycetota bacterium]